MNELRNDPELTTADIANPQRGRELSRTAVIDERPISSQSEAPGPQYVDQRPVASKGAPVEQRKEEEMADGPLFREEELQGFRVRWDQVQGSFVDEPRQAVEQADGLVANMVKRLAEEFSTARADLEKQWATGGDVSTEDLRQVLRRYRSFFNRLLPI
jgi:hypothetical protein